MQNSSQNAHTAGHTTLDLVNYRGISVLTMSSSLFMNMILYFELFNEFQVSEYPDRKKQQQIEGGQGQHNKKDPEGGIEHHEFPLEPLFFSQQVRCNGFFSLLYNGFREGKTGVFRNAGDRIARPPGTGVAPGLPAALINKLLEHDFFSFRRQHVFPCPPVFAMHLVEIIEAEIDHPSRIDQAENAIAEPPVKTFVHGDTFMIILTSLAHSFAFTG
jgi:hypothetical protein